MVKKLIRRGRVCGYRPTRTQLEEMLELAQREIDGPSASAQISYWQGNQLISPQGNLQKVLHANLDEILKDSDPKTRNLDNLYFEIRQDSPIERAVTVQIGVGGQWTTYEIRSADQTWAIGRYYELTDKFLNDRNMYSKGYSARPQVPRKAGGSTWKPGPWEAVDDLRIRLVKLPAWLWLWLWLAPIVAVGFAITILSWYYPGGNTPAGLRDHRNALKVIHWVDLNKTVIIGISLTYLFSLIPRYFWLVSLRKSIVVLKKSPILSQSSFAANSQNSIAIAGFYAALATLIVTIIALGIS